MISSRRQTALVVAALWIAGLLRLHGQALPTDHGRGTILYGTNGLTLQWTNVGCFVIVQRTRNLATWQNVLIAGWSDCPTNSRSFSFPIQAVEDRMVYRLLSYGEEWSCNCWFP
jgi:hypothetical protein